MQKLTNQSLEGKRKYVVEPGFAIWAPEKCCLFCKKLSDICWDYANGPYMFMCDSNGETEHGAIGECDSFENNYEEVDKQNKDREKQEQEIKELREKVKSDPAYKELLEDFGKFMADLILYGNPYGIDPGLLTDPPKPFARKEG